MTFQIKTYHVSHAGIPVTLDSLDEWQDYILDLNRELHAQRDAWRVYCQQNEPQESDEKRFAALEDRIEGLKHEAIGRMQAWENNRAPTPKRANR